MDTRTILRNGLLAFVLVTIGFAIGQESALRSLRNAAPAPADAPGPAAASAEKILVYYMHGKIRCVSCNTIEKQAQETVEREFAAELKDGRLAWHVVNYEEREDLAKRYNVISNGVVLAKQAGGKDLRSETLDDVWTLAGERPKFDAYLTGAIRAYLAPEARP